MTDRMKILIGYDGSDYAQSMFADLRRAGLPNEAEATLISVAEIWLMPTTYGVDASAIPLLELEDLRTCCRQAGKQLKKVFPDWQIEARVFIGSPAGMILLTAEELRADLIIVGALGHSALARFFIGSVCQRVATGAHCAVRVARAREVEPLYPPRVLIGLDGSPHSLAVVKTVAKRNWPAKSECYLVTAVGVSIPGGNESVMAKTMDESRAFARQIQQQAEAQLAAAGLNVSSAIIAGDPKKVLVEQADRWRADTIFVGSRGLGRIQRWLLGSVSTAIVSRANCSVEIVH